MNPIEQKQTKNDVTRLNNCIGINKLILGKSLEITRFSNAIFRFFFFFLARYHDFKCYTSLYVLYQP